MIPTLQVGQLGRRIKGGVAPLPTVSWNPADKSANINLQGGFNLIAEKFSGTSAQWDGVRATHSKSSGKHYFEVRHDMTSGSSNVFVGIAKSTPAPTAWLPGGTSTDYGYYLLNGNKYTNGSPTAYGAALVDNDVLGVLFDATAGTLEYFKNGVSQGVAFTGIPAGSYFPAVSLLNPSIFSETGRFKLADFTGALPSGASPWGG